MISCPDTGRATIRWHNIDGCVSVRMAGAVSVVLTTISMASAAGPAMSTTWVPTALDETACVQRAEFLVRDAGMSRNLRTIGPSVFGQVSAYTASVRCIADKGIVMFVVAGPDLEAARRHLRQISEKF